MGEIIVVNSAIIIILLAYLFTFDRKRGGKREDDHGQTK